MAIGIFGQNSTVSLNTNTIKRYIQNQDLEDKIKGLRSLKEYKDPYTGSKSDKFNWQTKKATKW